MSIKSISLSVLCISFSMLANNQEMKVVNNTDQQLNVGLTVPERTAAIIQFSKINNEPIAPKEDPKILLMRAITNDSAEEVINAIKAGASLKQLQPGKSPLLVAVLLKKGNAVRALLECGAEVAPKSNLGDQCLIDYALNLTDFKSATVLSEYFSKNNKIYGKPLFLRIFKEALHQADPEAVLYILKNSKAFCDQEKLKLNSFDISQNDINITDIINLLAKKPENDGVFVNAIAEIVQELIELGFEPNRIWQQYTNENKHKINEWIYLEPKILEVFIKNGANAHHAINFPRSNAPDLIIFPIFYAVQYKNTDAAKLLLDNGAFVNAITDSRIWTHNKGYDSPQTTPLSLAIKYGFADMVELLLSYGANL